MMKIEDGKYYDAEQLTSSVCVQIMMYFMQEHDFQEPQCRLCEEKCFPVKGTCNVMCPSSWGGMEEISL